MLKRILCLLLIVPLVVSMFPVAVLAEDVPEDPVVPETTLSTEPAAAAEETEPPVIIEVTEPAGETEPPATTEETEPPAATEETEPPETTEATEPPETTAATEPSEPAETGEVCQHEVSGDCMVCYAEALITALPELEEVEGKELTEEAFEELTIRVSEAMGVYYDELTVDQQCQTVGWTKLEALVSYLRSCFGEEIVPYRNLTQNIGDVIPFEGSEPIPTYATNVTGLTYTWNWSAHAAAGTPDTAFEVIREDTSSRYLKIRILQPGTIRVTATAHLTYYYYDYRLGTTRPGDEDASAGYWYITVNAPAVVVTYNANGGVASAQSRTSTNGSYGSHPTVSRKGYTFEGWYYGGQKCESNSYLASYDDHTLTARWAKDGTLKLDSKGGTPASYSKSILVNRPIGSILPSPTRKGYVLLGWTDSSGNSVSSSSKFSDGATIYAKWKQLRKISLDCNGGALLDGEAAEFEQIEGRSYPKLPVPVRENYIFTGWTLPDGTAVDSGDTMKLDMDHSLTAQWHYFPWSLQSGVLTVGGSGAMYDPGDITKFPWYPSRTEITSIVVADGLTSLANSAFDGCVNVTSVTINANLTHIGSELFSGCTKLKSIHLPGSLGSIGDEAFYNCSSLTGVDLPAGLTEIGDKAFYNCSSLTDLNLPASLTTIGKEAFYSCKKLTKLDFPAGLASIGSKAFRNCTGLKELVIPANTVIVADSFSGCSGVKQITAMPDQAAKAYSSCSNATHLTIMEGAAEIDDFDNSSLVSITLPSTLKSIGYFAFGNCKKLKKIVIPDSVTKIGDNAFQGCDTLTSVVIGSGVTSIGEKAFFKCKALTDVVIRDGVKTIGDSAFSNCTALRSITLPDTVTELGDAAFSKCSNLRTVKLSDNLETIGQIAFGTCKNLSSITIPASVRSIGSEAFGTCATCFTITFLGDAPRLGAYLFYNLRVTVRVPSNYYWNYSRGSYAAIKATWTYYDGFHTHSYGTATVTRKATCSMPGEELSSCSICNHRKVEVIPQAEHNANVTRGYSATCTESGKTDGRYCPDCDTVLSVQTVIPPTGHTEQIVPGTAADCLNDGKTDGAICSACKVTLKKQLVIPALGHDTARQGYLEAKCEEEGYTGDRICSRCNAITVPGEVIPAAGHTYTRVNGKLATCTAVGNTGHLECKDCKKLHETENADQELEALGHDPVLRRIPAQAATDTAYGNSLMVVDGCSRCSLWFTDETCQTVMTQEEITAQKQLPENIVYARAEKVEITEVENGVAEVTVGREVPEQIDLKDYPDGMLLRAKVLPQTAPQSITWSSSNVKIATVDQEGRVQFKKAGKVTITAAAANKCKATVTITAANQVEEVTIAGPSGEEFFIGGAAGKSITLKADVSPADATNKAVKWSVSELDKDLASISSKGVLKINKNAEPGSSIHVKAVAADGGGANDWIFVDVYPATKSIKLVPDEDNNGGSGERFWFKIVSEPETAAAQYVVTSSNLKVAAADWSYVDGERVYSAESYIEGDSFYVECTGVGKTTITCKAVDGSGVSAKYTLNVKPHIEWLMAKGGYSRYIAEGTSTKLELSCDPHYLEPDVTWRVSDPAVAVINQNGVLTTLPGSAGKSVTAIATAKDGYGATAEIDITITKPTEEIQLFYEDGTPLQDGDVIELDPFPQGDDVQWDDSWKCQADLTSKVLPEGAPNRLKFEVENTEITDPWQRWQWDNDKGENVYYDDIVVVSGEIAGKTKVTVKTYDGCDTSRYFYVKVKGQDMESLNLPQELQVLGGKTLTILPEIQPDNTTDKSLSWSVSGSTGVSIDGNGVLKTKTVKTLTSVKVTAKSNDGTGLEASAMVYIYPKATSLGIVNNGVAVTKKTLKLPTAGENTMLLSASALPAGASTDMVWTTSNAQIAAVQEQADGTCIVTAVGAGTATITAKAEDGSGKSTYMKVSVFNPVAGLTLTDAEVAGGKTLKLSASFAPANATDQRLSWTVCNPVENPGLASIDSKGQLKSKSVKVPTEVTVTAASRENPEITASCTVTLMPLASKVTLLQGEQVLPDSMRFSVEDLLCLGTQVTGKTADMKVSQSVTYSTSNASIAKVYQNGMVLPVQPGTVTITAKATDGSNQKDTVKLTIYQPMHELSITGQTYVAGGKRITLKAEVSPANTTTKKVVWTVSDTSLATVSGSGVLTAKAVSERKDVTVYAAAADGSGIMAAHNVRIYPAASKIGLEYYGNPVTAKSITMRVGEALNLDTVIIPENAYQRATWKSSNAKIAAVDNIGIITAQKKGSATITATAADGSGKKVSIKVNVK